METGEQLKKIALINPYFGAWPVWLPAFLQSCKYNPTIDWLLFTDCAIPEAVPDNVTFIPFSMADFNALASEKLGFDVCLATPYKACDFKPTFGVVFEDYIKGYDFWGHCDIDIIWGNIRTFITDDILRTHDVISSRKDMMSGHFSLYRNTPDITTVFTRHPDYQRILQAPPFTFFDERGVTKVLWPMLKQGKVRVYWRTYLMNFVDPRYDPSILGRYRNHWYWERGALYEGGGGIEDGGKEVMYLHFMTWKRSMQACYFAFTDDPSSFYISYSHIGLTREAAAPAPGRSLIKLYRVLSRWKVKKALMRVRKVWNRTRRRLTSMVEP